jgi:hypothetical protein
MLVGAPKWCCVGVWKHPYPNAGPLQQLMMSVGLSVGAPKLMTRLPGPQRMNSSKWCTRPMNAPRCTDHHARGRALPRAHLLTTLPVTTPFRSWNMTPSPWAAAPSHVPLRRAVAVQERGRSPHARTHGPRSRCRPQSARRNSRCWAPRPLSRRRRSRSSTVPAAEATMRQSAAREAGRRQWVFRARAAQAWRRYRRRAWRCGDDSA